MKALGSTDVSGPSSPAQNQQPWAVAKPLKWDKNESHHPTKLPTIRFPDISICHSTEHFITAFATCFGHVSPPSGTPKGASPGPRTGHAGRRATCRRPLAGLTPQLHNTTDDRIIVRAVLCPSLQKNQSGAIIFFWIPLKDMSENTPLIVSKTWP